MKIAMLGTKGIPATWGGVERHVEEIATRFVKMGHDVTVYCRPYYTTTNEEFYKGVRLKVLPTIQSKNYDAITHTFIATMHLLMKDYDIVHYHALGPATMSLIPRLVGKKTVATVHGLDWQREKWGGFAKYYLRLGERAAAVFPHATVAVSKYLKEYLETGYKRNIYYIPSGVIEPEFLLPSIIRSYGLEGGDYILFVARLVPEKGCHFLIDAYNRLNTDKKLVIAGGSSHSDSYVKELQASASDKVIFTGYVHGAELQELFSNAYCYVQPSTIEGLAITLLEAISYGRCVITSDIPPNLEAAENVGLIFENKNVDDLERVLRMAVENPDMVEEYGQRARTAGVAEYGFDSVATKIEKVYTAIADGKKGQIADLDTSSHEPTIPV
ncbi:MAG: glycosyltransferase family 4 protein [Armatimonadota bacterium]